MIDAGFVIASLAAMIVTIACTERHLRAAWRICLGLAVIPPLSLLWLRIKLKEPESYSRSKMSHYPWWLIIKFYGYVRATFLQTKLTDFARFRLCIVSLIWFIYDFSSYSFSIYSTSWLAFLLPADAPLWKSFGWGTLINFFYIPGAFVGAFLSDWIGPKYALALGVVLQGAIGFLMSGIYSHLDQASQVGGFVVIYGIFLSLGEVGPGDNIGLIASKTSATSIRGQYYGIAAAIGKIGAFVGTYVFPDIIAAGGDDVIKQGQYPFFVSSALCIFSGIITLLFIPNIGQDTIDHEDQRFKEYLKQHGYDIDSLGTQEFKERRQSLRTGL